jgi:hypothetical protein
MLEGGTQMTDVQSRQAVDPFVEGGTTRVPAVLGLVGALLQVCGGILESVDRVRPGEAGFGLQVVFPVATILIGVRMTVVGIFVYRGHRWAGWRRAIPLVCGLYPFLVIFPAFAAAGGPNFLVLAGWGACWVALAAAAAMEASETRTTPT